MILDPHNVGIGLAFAVTLKEGEKQRTHWHVEKCTKCFHYLSNSDECLFYIFNEKGNNTNINIYSARDMREGNAFVFRFWKNCGKKAKFFKAGKEKIA